MSGRAAVEAIVDKVTAWGEGLVVMLPNVAVAIGVLLIFGLLARVAARIVHRSLERVSDNAQARALLATFTRTGVMLVGAFVALGVLQLDGTVTSLLAGVGVLGLALGFAFQDIAANFMAGILLALNRPFRIGDVIETSGGFFGTVEEMTLRATLGRSFDGLRIIVPNKDVFSSTITNYGQSPDRRIDVNVGVAYGDDLDEAERIATETITAYDKRNQDKDVEIYWTGFGDSSVDFVLRFWIRSAEHSLLEAKSDAIKRIKKAFDTHGITIPFPIRTMDFGVVGGTRLDEVLPGSADGARGDAGPTG